MVPTRTALTAMLSPIASIIDIPPSFLSVACVLDPVAYAKALHQAQRAYMAYDIRLVDPLRQGPGATTPRPSAGQPGATRSASATSNAPSSGGTPRCAAQESTSGFGCQRFMSRPATRVMGSVAAILTDEDSMFQAVRDHWQPVFAAPAMSVGAA